MAKTQDKDDQDKDSDSRRTKEIPAVTMKDLVFNKSKKNEAAINLMIGAVASGKDPRSVLEAALV